MSDVNIISWNQGFDKRLLCTTGTWRILLRVTRRTPHSGTSISYSFYHQASSNFVHTFHLHSTWKFFAHKTRCWKVAQWDVADWSPIEGLDRCSSSSFKFGGEVIRKVINQCWSDHSGVAVIWLGTVPRVTWSCSETILLVIFKSECARWVLPTSTDYRISPTFKAPGTVAPSMATTSDRSP